MGLTKSKLTKTSVPSSGDQEMNVILLLFRQVSPLEKSLIETGDSVLPLSLAGFQLVFEVVHRISWALAFLALVPGLGVHELLLERFPVAICRFLFNNDLLVVVRKLIDNVFDGSFAELEFVKCRYALWCDGDTRGRLPMWLVLCR